MKYALTSLLSLSLSSPIALAPAAFAQPDLAVAKTGPSTATAGSQVPFDVTITNSGTAAATAVQLTDPAARRNDLRFGDAEQRPCVQLLRRLPVGTNGTITCSIATLSTGASANFTFLVNIPIGTAPGTVFTNTATASSTPADSNYRQ